MRLRSYRVCEHVCPIRCVLVICLDEERHERCSIDIQTLIVPKEEAPGIGCYRHIEGRRGDTYLVTEARAMVGRRHEPGRDPEAGLGGLAIVGIQHGDRVARRHDRRRERVRVRLLVDGDQRRPHQAAVLRDRDDDRLV